MWIDLSRPCFPRLPRFNHRGELRFGVIISETIPPPTFSRDLILPQLSPSPYCQHRFPDIRPRSFAFVDIQWWKKIAAVRRPVVVPASETADRTVARGRLFEDRPQLGRGALGGAVSEVEELLDTVLLGLTVSLLSGDTLDALVEVVLGRRALL